MRDWGGDGDGDGEEKKEILMGVGTLLMGEGHTHSLIEKKKF